MSAKLKELELRQQELKHQAHRERKDFAEYFEAWEKPLSWVDKGVDTVNFLRSNPIVWTSAFAALAHYKPRFASKALAVGWGAMKIIKSAKKLV
ncbi:YqjK-like family protein [Polynucleobacter sp. AP-Reno-20A-A9]|uniref:YqjK family protein n=1 Tax=Polynucleobacter sp. AP-Reno-20A-A9 TaxID=2576925 RepID=UPI001C0E2F5E|nr:YqjK-like family protein [Polynucleobacter sp. AP-Reno-20A-A9]MBU3628564.1 YqjK-like family protein [Polynucleobacter sp. AP-Reno-20A-A9]